MQTRRTTRKQPGGTARRASAVVALAAAASLGALGAASAQGVGGRVPVGASSTAIAGPTTTGGTTGVSASVTTVPDVSTAPTPALDRDDVLALLTRADDYLAAHTDAVGGPVAQAASETGMLLVTYDAQVAATAALTPPVDLPVSALEPPDPLTTSPWDKAVGKTAAGAADDAASTTDPTGPTSTEGTAPSSTTSSTAGPGSTSSPTLPSDGATTGGLAADGAAPTGLLPTTGTTPTGTATDAPAEADDPAASAGDVDSSTSGDLPQANPASPAGTVDGGATGSLIPDPATTAVHGSMPSVDDPTSPPAIVPGATPSPAPTGSAPIGTPSPAPTSGVPTVDPTTAPTSPTDTVPAPSGDATIAPSTAPTTDPDGSAPTATAPPTAAPTGQGTPSTGPSPSATETPAPGTDATGLGGSSSAGTGSSTSDGTTSATTDPLADPDEQNGTTPVTWSDVVAAAERLATALDAAEAADVEADGLTGPGVVDGVAVAGASLTGGLADQLKTLVDRYGTSVDGYKNGELPDSVLCPLDFAPGQRLRCDAANRLEALSKLFEKQFGHPIPLTDSYRPLAVQIELRKTKPNLAAVPGTSNHGWGIAVDMGYPISTGRSAEYLWLRQHGPAYGWDNPSWAHLDGSKPEPWHFEFHGGGLLPTGTPVTDYTGVTAPADAEDAPEAPSAHPTAPKMSEPAASTVMVPKGLVGQPFATVQKKLEGLGLKVAKPTTAYSATVKAGSVLRVTPGSGSKVKAGSTVRAVVSQGPKPAATVKIPDGLAGQPLATVQKKLEGLGLKVADPTPAYSDTVDKGSVISVSPDEGASVKAGSTVTLVVSQGPKPPATVTIPAGLAGQPLATVQKKLAPLGLKVVVDPKKVYSDTVAAGSVVSLSPDEGTSVKAGSTVTLVVSQGPKPPATVTIPTGLVGQDPDTVEDSLVALGLKVVIADVEQPSDAPAGTVAGLTQGDGTELAEGSQVEAGSTVTVVVSSGPTAGSDPDPTGTPTTTPTGDTATSAPTGGTTGPAVAPTEAAREADTE